MKKLNELKHLRFSKLIFYLVRIDYELIIEMIKYFPQLNSIDLCKNKFISGSCRISDNKLQAIVKINPNL